MVTDAQVKRLRKKLMEAKTMEAAAMAAGMSERSARTWKTGALPSQTKAARDWRTRPDPFAEVWTSEVVPLLDADEKGVLEAKTVIGAPLACPEGRYRASVSAYYYAAAPPASGEDDAHGAIWADKS